MTSDAVVLQSYPPFDIVTAGPSGQCLYVRHVNEAVAIEVRDAVGNRLLILQHRPALKADVWEFPAGGLELSEAPLAGAKRELSEEVGIDGLDWEYLGSFHASSGSSNQRFHMARASVAGRRPDLVVNREEGIVEYRWVSEHELRALIRRGEVATSHTVLTYVHASGMLG